MIKTITIECSLENLMDVLNATGNAKVATAILNGDYEAPGYPEEIIGDFRTKKEKVTVDGVEEEIETKEPIIYKALSYNPFTNAVHYQYESSSYHSARQEHMDLSMWLKRDEKNGSPYSLGA